MIRRGVLERRRLGGFDRYATVAPAMILLGSGVIIFVRHGRIAWNTAFGRLVVSAATVVLFA
jgi:hypothetical protein